MCDILEKIKEKIKERSEHMRDLKITKLTKVILDIMFYGGIAVLLTLPFILRAAGRYYSKEIADNYIPMLLVFVVAGIFGVLIISRLRRMMRTVLDEDCFVSGNVQSLRAMAGFSLCIAVLFVIKMLFLATPATGVIILVFFVAALFSEVLAHVFAEAIRYKEENDLTI